MTIVPETAPTFGARHAEAVFSALRVRGIQMMSPLIRINTITSVVIPTMIFPTDFSPFEAGGSSSQRCSLRMVWKKGYDWVQPSTSPV